MTGVLQDIRYAIRQISKNLGLTLIVVLTLGLGICANSTIFSWIQSTLLEPIPGAGHTGDLVSVMRGPRNTSPNPPFSYPDLVDLRQRAHSVSGVLGYHHDWMALTGHGEPQRVYGTLTTANYFDLLEVRPMLGRSFRLEEERAPGGAPVAVISYSLWQTHYGGDPRIVGKVVEVNLHPFTVVGVAPEGFFGCMTGVRTDIWFPLSNDPALQNADRIEHRGDAWLNVLARLKQGVDRTGAEGELNRVMTQLVAEFPDDHRGPNQITLDPLWRSPFGANIYLYSTLPVLLGLAGALLLLACANVATLLLVRSFSRRRELAIRLSLGASHWRTIRQLLLESLLLAIGGGAVALLATFWSAGTFANFIPHSGNSIMLNGHVDGTVALATLGMCLLTGILFGIVPAIRTTKLEPGEVLKQEEGSVSTGIDKSRLSSALVVVQIAVSLVLLLCAGLFLQTLRNTERADPGFNPDHVLLASISLGPAGYSPKAEVQFQRELLSKLGTLPGVQSAAIADWLPMNFSRRTSTIVPEGYVPQVHESMETRRAAISPDYFQTMGIPVLRGRSFSPSDTETSLAVAIVDDEMARLYWPGMDPLGRRIRVNGQWFTVVGVARHSKHSNSTEAAEPMVYLSLSQNPQSDVYLHLKTSVSPESISPEVVAAVHSLNPGLPVFDVMTLQSSMRQASIFARIGGVFVGAFGLIALALAAVGIYGVVAYTTRQRTHEIGIRIALGASPAQVQGLVIGQGLRLMAAGLATGWVAAFLVTRLLRGSLVGVAAMDPLTLAGVSALLGVVVLLACFVPARRATHIDPMTAVRSE
jgi:putative ABC transport system permease protein